MWRMREGCLAGDDSSARRPSTMGRLGLVKWQGMVVHKGISMPLSLRVLDMPPSILTLWRPLCSPGVHRDPCEYPCIFSSIKN